MSTSRARPHFAATAGFLLAVVVLFWAMAAISAWVTRTRLASDAHRTYAALRDDQPLWRWTLHHASDLVAGRAFGPVNLAIDRDGLRLTSLDGAPFELGLPLASPIDLGHWPLIRLHLHSSGAGTLGLTYQRSETSTACLAADAVRIAAGDSEPLVDVRSLTWRTPNGAPCPPPQVVTYMWRLRPQLPPGDSLLIDQVALLAPGAASRAADIGKDVADIRLGPDASLDGASPAAAQSGTPVVRLPEDASAEAMLNWRDQARQRWPAALILPFGLSLQPVAGSSMPPWLDWPVVAIYLAWLGWLLRRQTREVRHPWVEVAAIAAGPLWLIAGLRWSETPSIPGIVAFTSALVYAGWSEWKRRPVAWRWVARGWSDWLWAFVPLPVAITLVLLDGHGLTALPLLHVAAYFGWALLQQWAMLAIVMGRLQHTGLPRPAIVLVTATLFGLLHTPNGSLMQLCLVAELWWAWRFLKAPRLLPIAVAHALCALLVESALTGHLLRSLQVSARFFL
ncbi:hypothetical protein DVT68_01210 [Dyella solisilvae]|uniref:CAAX prenyl protease 2/Lysostaphin resistance protein A-like domain-containing protein n=1 Tax=Dyella solisilvae TaxID=1920168 RepID=A0A370KAN3_9GAMM|nr:CPBP family glutamic-type intramembrane protease [Dyella solisilvae]RDI99507.1 hypothetical protein DVT68_01210 [Dyella solisilvae]